MVYLKNIDPLLVIIGPSGSGKSSTIRLLSDQDVIKVTPSWTTRPPRPGELKKGIEHQFVSEKVFQTKENKGFFVEVVKMFDLPYKYGLTKIHKLRKGIVPVIMLRASLIPLLSKHYNKYIIYQIEDSPTRVQERLRLRMTEGELMGSRFKDYRKEIDTGRSIAKRIFINKTDIASLAFTIQSAIILDFDKQ